MRVIFQISILILLTFNLLAQEDTIFSKSGSILFTGQLKEGKKHGVWNEYSPEGKVVRKIEMIDSKGKCNIIPVGNKKISGRYMGYFFLDKVILDGSYQLIDSNANSQTVGRFKFGKKVGQWVYYKNNLLKHLDLYITDLPSFSRILFDDKERILSICGYDSLGFLDGKSTTFDTLMRVSSIGEYKHGSKIGDWIYFKEGKLESKGNYYNDYLRRELVNDSYLIVNKEGLRADSLYSKELIKQFENQGANSSYIDHLIPV